MVSMDIYAIVSGTAGNLHVNRGALRADGVCWEGHIHTDAPVPLSILPVSLRSSQDQLLTGDATFWLSTPANPGYVVHFWAPGTPQVAELEPDLVPTELP